MPVCGGCGKQWPAGTRVCPTDGGILTPSKSDGWEDTDPGGQKKAPTDPPVVTVGSAVAAPAPAGGDLAAGTMIGEYQIEKRIGQGGMAVVYSAVHPVIGKKAAIKVISHQLSTDAEAIKRFRQEARSVNQIGHLHIVDIFSFGSLADGRSYFVMELLQGESLSARMERQRLSLAESVEILEQICDALEGAHEVGIVHRDLKPDNVFLVKQRSRKPMVKLLDFGIAKLGSSGSDGPGLMSHTKTGMIMGTPGYISPEQARGKGVDHRTDVYALGCMAYEMVLGQLPFQFDNAADAIRAHLVDPPPLPTSIWPEIPPALDGVLLEMLEKDPQKRPQLPHLRQVLDEVRQTTQYMADWGNSEPIRVTATNQPRIPTPGPRVAQTVLEDAPRKNRTPILAAIAGVVLAGAVIGVVAMRKSPPPPPPSLPAPVVVKHEDPPPAPRPVAPPAPTTGTIAVTVNAADARIELDGKLAATGNAKIPADGGPHTIVVTAPGRVPYKKTVAVAVGATVNVNVKLRSPARTQTAEKKQAAGSADGYLLDPFGNKKK